ncbi:MAG: FtsW/RodA/SpoVE family cell cycle protein [Thermoanaerobaculales bacterium]|jgi:rod shape determining protein RodA|nr:FtsW/RodA/SpoVE family cell cycle protein [Thermoanaerobaculales bacterium]
MENRIDAWLILAVIGILGASLVTQHAVAEVVGVRLLTRQLVWAAAGLASIFALSRLRLDLYARFAPVLYTLGLITLVGVLFFGDVRSGTRGWFAIGPLTLQPSEFARVTTIVMVAAWLGRRSGSRLSVKGTAIVTALVGTAAGLVAVEPDLGVALTYLPVLVAALWLGGLPRWAWLLAVVLALVAASVSWHIALKPFQKERVLTVLDPERDPFGAGYQVRQSKIAVGSGGLVGEGMGQGSQSLLRYLPAQHTDFAFAVWAEATGFLGATVLLLAYALLLFRIGLTAAVAENRHGLALSILVGAWLAFQVVVNLGMVLGLLPTTGITLPLFSYGGSSLLSTCAALGVVQSVWRHRLVNQ